MEAWRNQGETPRGYIPAPLAKGKVETSFSKPAEADFHHLELTGVLGLEWLLQDSVSLGLAYGARNEITSPEAPWHFGLELYYRVTNLTLLTWDKINAITLDSNFELFYSDMGASNILKGIGSTRVSVSILGYLALTGGLDVFLYKSGSGGMALSVDTLLWLTVSLETSVMGF